jgi:hypothetical protein
MDKRLIEGPCVSNNEWIKEVTISRALLGTCADKFNCDSMQHLNGHNHTKPQLDRNSRYLLTLRTSGEVSPQMTSGTAPKRQKRKLGPILRIRRGSNLWIRL